MKEKTELQIREEEQIMTAWNKIIAWSKANLAGKFPNGLEINFPHDPYIWQRLVVNPLGEIMIWRNGHHEDRYPSYVMTDCKAYYADGRRVVATDSYEVLKTKNNHDRMLFGYDYAKDVILNWPSWKARLLAEARKNDSIATFEP